MKQWLVYPLEALGVWTGYAFLAAMPPSWASATGGWMGRQLGQRLFRGRHRTAERNLRRAFPDQHESWYRQTLDDMWEHLGRVVAEFPHLETLAKRVELDGVEHIRTLNSSRACILVSGHLGNWELLLPTLRAQGVHTTSVYRRPNNPWFDKFIRFCRGIPAGMLLAKGRKHVREVFGVIDSGRWLTMLVDQKLNNGIKVPFCGRDAMTSPVVAMLFLKYRCPIMIGQLVRVEGARFCFQMVPFEPRVSGDYQTDLYSITAEINRYLESVIGEYPGQWLWIHNRWIDN